MSMLGAPTVLGPTSVDSAPHQEDLAPGPGVPSLELMAELLVVLSPGLMVCTVVGPLGYRNLLLTPGRGWLLLLLLLLFTPTAAAAVVSPAAGEMGWELLFAWGLGKLKPWVGAAPLLPAAPSLAPTVTGGGLAGELGEALVFIIAGLAPEAEAGDPGSCLML